MTKEELGRTDDAKRIFQNLEGTWRFARTLSDQANDMFFTAGGQAVFEKMDSEQNQLYYREMGVLNLSGKQKEVSFYRKYIFRLTDEMIQVLFDDGASKGKLYQALLPKQEKGQFVGTEHLCVDDTYTGLYSFPNENEFSVVYMVQGPNKNLEIKTIYKKQGART